MAEILEIAMMILFGCSWPFNVVRSYKARTAKGKSISFLILVIIGYTAGIASKFANPRIVFSDKWYVLFFYFLNVIMVIMDLLLYFRNIFLDKMRDREIGDGSAIKK